MKFNELGAGEEGADKNCPIKLTSSVDSSLKPSSELYLLSGLILYLSDIYYYSARSLTTYTKNLNQGREIKRQNTRN